MTACTQPPRHRHLESHLEAQRWPCTAWFGDNDGSTKSTLLNSDAPLVLALARAVPKIPAADDLPGGGGVYEPKWDGYGLMISSTETQRPYGASRART